MTQSLVAGDPVETGIVPSLARPGGNITGVSLMASALSGKSVELFRDMLPSLRRVGYWATPRILCSRKPCLMKFYSPVGPRARK
jgi:ABC-type uncharacterized transport system substrate-binding protein